MTVHALIASILYHKAISQATEKESPSLQTKNIVILTSKTGGGHLSLAEALRDLVMEQTEQQATSEENDTVAIQATGISLIDPQPGLFHLHYRLVSRHALRLWAAD